MRRRRGKEREGERERQQVGGRCRVQMNERESKLWSCGGWLPKPNVRARGDNGGERICEREEDERERERELDRERERETQRGEMRGIDVNTSTREE